MNKFWEYMKTTHICYYDEFMLRKAQTYQGIPQQMLIGYMMEYLDSIEVWYPNLCNMSTETKYQILTDLIEGF